MNVSAVILAAGSSRRLGFDKAQISFEGKSLVDLIKYKVYLAGISHMITVGRPQDAWASVVNPRHAEGLSSSIRVAVESLAFPNRPVIFFTVDQWQLPIDHIRQLAEGLKRASAVGTIYGPKMSDTTSNVCDFAHVGSFSLGKRGVPAGFHPEHFEKLMGLGGEMGARRILDQVIDTLWLPCPEAAFDLDTLEDYQEMRTFETLQRDFHSKERGVRDTFSGDDFS